MFLLYFFFNSIQRQCNDRYGRKTENTQENKSARRFHLSLIINIIPQKVLFDFPPMLWPKLDDS